MASRKRTPETSRITRGATVAYARKHKSGGDADDGEPKADAKEPAVAAPAPAPAETGAPQLGDGPKSAHGNELPVALAPAAPATPPAAPAPGGPQPGDGPKSAHHNEPPVALAAAPTTVEDPTQMPDPRGLPAGAPGDPAPPPGRVPPGDSRSLRHGGEFALIYRVGTFVITRIGVVGTRGEWRVVEYPTSASASHAYAKACSRFVADGFSDYRD